MNMHKVYSLLCVLPLLALPVYGQTFKLRDTFIGKNFLDGFKWETFDDPTHGRVNYVDKATSLKNNYTYASDTKFVMRPDFKKNVPSGARGRDSNRITSKNAYTDSVMVLDLQHMPDGCGTWPAFWTFTNSGKWPHGGEIDIIEGVNINGQNTASLHTTAGCTMPPNRQGVNQTGVVRTTNCDANTNGNIGCGNEFVGSGTYGNSLNANGGGWYVMVRTNRDGVSVYFWGRNDGSVPGVVRNGGGEITPDASWGMPQARFPTNNCDFNKYFDAHQVVFDLTFCGDWASGTFSQQNCPGNCIDFVDNNPDAFRNAYWEVNSLRVYTP